jgi:hypothetical protein
MVSDAAIAIVPDDALPVVLSHLHRAGLGHTARVLRPKRVPMRQQLARAGVPTDDAPDRLDDATAVLYVNAAVRSPMAANLALLHGASASWVVTRAGAWTLIDDHLVTPSGTQAPGPASLPSAPIAGDDATDTPGPI